MPAIGRLTANGPVPVIGLLTALDPAWLGLAGRMAPGPVVPVASRLVPPASPLGRPDGHSRAPPLARPVPLARMPLARTVPLARMSFVRLPAPGRPLPRARPGPAGGR